MVTTSSPLVGPPSGTLHQALSYRGGGWSPVTTQYLTELWRLAPLVGIDPAILAAQSAHETANWSSDWWLDRHNPAGIGITGDPEQNEMSQTWANGVDAARGHVLHMLAYLYAPSEAIRMMRQGLGEPPNPPSNVWRYDQRYTAPWESGYTTTALTIDDLTGRWAKDPQYAEKIVAKHRAMFGAGGETVTTPETIDYSPLPFPVRVHYVPVGQTNNRPGIPMQAESGTWHETANYSDGTGAAMHEQWLLNGAPGAASAQVCVHYFVDDHEAVQMLPLNEVAWHAGDGATGTGNMTSIAVECCVNSDGDLVKAQLNTARLFGLLRARGVIDDVVQHNHWSGKDCPHLLRLGESVTWESALGTIGTYSAQYATSTTQPDPIWWTPGDVGPQRRESDGAVALAMIGEVTARRRTPIYRNAAMRKTDVIETWTTGTVGKIVGTYIRPSKPGKRPTRVAFIEIDGGYGRALLSAFAPTWPTT